MISCPNPALGSRVGPIENRKPEVRKVEDMNGPRTRAKNGAAPRDVPDPADPARGTATPAPGAKPHVTGCNGGGRRERAGTGRREPDREMGTVLIRPAIPALTGARRRSPALKSRVPSGVTGPGPPQARHPEAASWVVLANRTGLPPLRGFGTRTARAYRPAFTPLTSRVSAHTRGSAPGSSPVNFPVPANDAAHRPGRDTSSTHGRPVSNGKQATRPGPVPRGVRRAFAPTVATRTRRTSSDSSPPRCTPSHRRLGSIVTQTGRREICPGVRSGTPASPPPSRRTARRHHLPGTVPRIRSGRKRYRGQRRRNSLPVARRPTPRPVAGWTASGRPTIAAPHRTPRREHRRARKVGVPPTAPSTARGFRAERNSSPAAHGATGEGNNRFAVVRCSGLFGLLAPR
ncbi:hypothetical protein FTUN_6195 [Frigoriglobus tundricola]|uniref:Uncharacterized protein n=1 Tax=Frigoriglobus tundricola TaxID=2774151 RepID=A0A6M5YYR1_9BACT|nr:hypothetical protein FTUN_6195 [Frigoriglobus tundricola]